MARMIKCPSCGTQMDVGTAQPGAIVACPGCQVKIRIPTGKTSANLPAVSAAAPRTAPAPSAPRSAPARGGRRRGMARGGGTTRTRIASARRGGRAGGDEEGDEEGHGPPPKKSNTGLIVGIVAGVAVIAIIIIAVAMNSGGSGQEGQPTSRRSRRSAEPVAPMVPVAPIAPIAPIGPVDPVPVKPKAGGVLSPKVWEDTINALKRYSSMGAGGEFYDHAGDPEASMAYDRVKSLGPRAYPYLIYYLTDQEPQRGKGALVALKNLCGDPRKGGSVGKLNPGNCQGYKTEWMGILNVDEAEVQKAAEELKGATGTDRQSE